MSTLDRTLATIASGRRADPLRPVTVIVPSHIAGLQLRRWLAARGAFAAVRFEILPRLAELIGAGALAEAGRSPLARPIGDYLAETVAREARFGSNAAFSEMPGLGRVLRLIFRRLRRAGISDPSRVQAGLDSRQLAEVLRLYAIYRQRSAAFYDDEDLLDSAAAAIRSGSGLGADVGDVYVVPPGAQTAGSAAMLAALRRRAASFRLVDESNVQPTQRFLLAPDPASEVRGAVREVLTALESGLGLHEIAVFYGADRSYRGLLGEAFTAAGLPAALMPGLSLAETRTGRGVLALATLPDQDYSRAAAFDFLAVAPLREFLPAGAGSVRGQTTAWDRISRDAGITRGAGRWRRGLDAAIGDREGELAIAQQIGESRAAYAALDLARAHDLSDFMSTLIARLEPLRAVQPAPSFIATFKRLVHDYLEPRAAALEAVEHEIDQLGTVGAVGGRFSLQSFTRALRANLEASYVRETSMGAGILVADYRQAAGLEFRHVVICGAVEGALPSAGSSEPILASNVWSDLRRRFPYIEDHDLRMERGRQAARRAVSAAGSGTVVWTSPLYEPAGTREYHPSPLMVEAARTRSATIETATDLRQAPASGWLSRASSPLSSLLAGPALDLGEVNLRRAMHERRSGVMPGPGHRLETPLALLRGRRNRRFTIWDGNLTALAGDPWLRRSGAVSPTSLEDYATCGFRYLARNLFRVNVVDEPGERELMAANDKGTLVHQVLDTFFREMQAVGRPRLREAWTAADRERLLAIAAREIDAARQRGKTGLDVFAAHDATNIRADLAAFLDADSAFRIENGTVPAAFEVRIPEMTVGGVVLRGVADRIDYSADGTRAWVIDYKSGGSASYAAVNETDPLAGGTRLQLPSYVSAAAGATEITSMYWFISRREEFKDVQYVPSPENQERFAATLTSIVSSIEGGIFPAVPGDENDYYDTFANCRYCDFKRICSRRRDLEFDAKVGDEPVVAWLEIARTARGEP